MKAALAVLVTARRGAVLSVLSGFVILIITSIVLIHVTKSINAINNLKETKTEIRNDIDMMMMMIIMKIMIMIRWIRWVRLIRWQKRQRWRTLICMMAMKIGRY